MTKARKRISRRRRLLVALSLPLVVVLVTTLFIVYDGLTDELHQADVAIIPGNTVLPDGRPSPRLQARLDRALQLYRQAYFAVIIVSGGFGKEGFDEATVMKSYLVEHGVPPAQVLVDSQGNNTRLTAMNAARLMQEHHMRSAVVVSQYFHITRCKLVLHKRGIATVYGAHARYFELRDLYSTIRETVGIYAYLIG